MIINIIINNADRYKGYKVKYKMYSNYNYEIILNSLDNVHQTIIFI